MAERVDLMAARDPFEGFGANQDYFGMFNPGGVVRGLRHGNKGNETSPDIQDAMTAVQTGAYGLPEWDALFGDDGRVTDADGLLRALNVGSVFGDWTTIKQAADTYGTGDYGGEYDAWGGGWHPGTVGGGPYLDSLANAFGLVGGVDHEDMKNAYRRSFGQAYEGGADPGLLDWIRQHQDFGSTINDWRERFYDPNNIAYGSYDLGGVDIRNASLDELNAWAEQTYGPGVDLLQVAASSPELLQFRQQVMANPDEYFNADTGAPTFSQIPGLRGEDAAARMASYEAAMKNAQAEFGAAGQDYTTGLLNSLISRDPEFGRTSLGRAYSPGGQASVQSALGANAGLMSPMPNDYSFLAAAGLAPEMTEGVLQQLRLQYGG